ncbi:hypothetical protein EUGRSUZ_E00998 [Eucalyptus grandis]|uniref:Uncharacterized protein n=2 Tax=Eucalyptus grandis TaxID=71139 RepID=A0ACC3KP68_EUCGR|nr:hypothetical protein EUGRSUZ_E00998 [Eucalyptus grandis]
MVAGIVSLLYVVYFSCKLSFFAEPFNMSFRALLISPNYYVPRCLLCVMIRLAQEDLESLCLKERIQ